MASGGDREKLLAQVRRDVRSLLISAKSGLAIQDLYRDYQSLVFSPLPYRQLGFETARSFLQSIPDVCRCQMLPSGDCLVTAVADSSTAHIQKMVERQKPSQKRGATARVLASRHVRRSTTSRTFSYRSQPAPTQTYYRPPAAPRPLVEPVRPRPKPPPSRERAPPPERGSPEPVPARVAGRLAQVLLARQDGVSADRLPELYDAAAPGDEPLDWEGRGYRSCAELLLQLPHIARVVSAFSGLRVYPSRALLEADREAGGRHSRQSAAAEERRSAAAEGRRSRQSATEDAGGGGDSRPEQQEEKEPPSAEPERRHSPSGTSGGAAVTSGSSSSGRRRDLLASISETVQSIVERHPNGLLCSKLPAEYRLKTGSDLALTELGYHSVLDLVSRLKLRVIKSNAFGDWLLFTQDQTLPDFVNDQTQADDGLIAELEEDGSKLQQAKERIRDILLSFPDGLRMTCLEDHYQMNCNERLPYAALGFSSVETFALHLTQDVLNLKYTPDGLKLFPIMPLHPEQAVSRELYPVDAVGAGRSFERVKLPVVPPGVFNLEIFVAEVYHPHKFWFHLVGEQYAEALETLMDDMELTYCTTLGFKYRMLETTVRVGQVCACPYGDQGYHRAVITGVRPAPEPVKVFYVDYGSVGTVSRNFLRFLPEKYFSLPAQALLGRLANIEPPVAEGWSRDASKTFLSLVDNNRILYAMVLDRSESCASLVLCDTNGETDVHINDRLVELDCAIFRHQSSPDQEAEEELGRPVSVEPSPKSSATAPAAQTVSLEESVALVTRLSVLSEAEPEPEPEEPEPEPRPASDTDRLLREMLGSPISAVAAVSPVTPVSPSAPGQPPGFSGLPPPPPLPTVAPGASSAAFAQMLTQSALISNLQMMQLNLMNPMMNPAYAALLMSQAAAGAAPALSVSAAPPAAPAPAQTPASSAAWSGVTAAPSAVPPAASRAPRPPPAAAASVPSVPTSPEIPAPLTLAPLAPVTPAPLPPASVVSSGLDAGVCITAPIQAESAPSRQELTEEEIAQMNRELGELAIQRRFIKRISVPVGVVHLICLEGAGYLVSAEISNFLWARDILHTMLLMKRVTLPHRSVDVESHQELFAELIKYSVPGVLDGEELVDPLTLYPITCVPRVFALFKNMTNEHDVKGIIEDIIAEFDPADPYWTSADAEEEAELAELCSEPAAVSPPLASSPPQLQLELAPPGTAEAAESTTVYSPSVVPVSPEQGEQEEGATADLLPEMRAILAQLQDKRRRKVEATMLGLRGTDFTPEDVIGEDLQRMDAQIASFQRRIDALVADRPAGRRTSVRTTSISSMNPDAPEFVHPNKESLLASANSTLCAAEPAEPAEPAAASRRRVTVELRAPDGTPVELSQLVSRAQTLQRRHSGGGGGGDPPPPARKPVELRTPDGQQVHLSRPLRAASTPHGSPPALSVVSAATAPARPAAAVHHQPAPAPAPGGHQPAPPAAAGSHQPAPPPGGHQPPRYPVQPLRPATAPPPQQWPGQQPPQQQWTGQQPAYGLQMYPTYQQPYLAYQQMYPAAAGGPFPRLGFPQQQLVGMPLSYQPPQYPAHQAQPPRPPAPAPAPAFSGK